MTSSYGFTIMSNKVLHCNRDGSGSVEFNATDFVIPPGQLPSGLPASLSDLIMQVGPQNVVIDYYVSASGRVSGYDCGQAISLYAIGELSDTTISNSIHVAQDQGHNGGPVPQVWYPLFDNTNKILTKVTSHSVARGSGRGCYFESYGGWDKTQIQINTVVQVNLAQYCKNNPQICNRTPPGPPGPPSPPVPPGPPGPPGPSAQPISPLSPGIPIPSGSHTGRTLLILFTIIFLILLVGFIIFIILRRKKKHSLED